jgi:streptogramin lyase
MRFKGKSSSEGEYLLGAYGRITPKGQITEFPFPPKAGYPLGITSGPDGNMWVTGFRAGGPWALGRISIDGRFFAVPLPGAWGGEMITRGPDKNLWFTQFWGGRIGRSTTAGEWTEFPLPDPVADPRGIAVGPDGKLWFTESRANRIGSITTSGALSEFALPHGGEPWDIAVGPDGNLWFTEYGTDRIGRITPSGKITEFPLPPLP